MNKKMLKLSTLFLVFLGFVGVLYASWTVLSPTVTVTVTDYELTISNVNTCRVTETITFSGILSLNGSPVPDETVELYKDNVATGLTDITASDGAYSIVWSATENGTFSFYTQVVIEA